MPITNPYLFFSQAFPEPLQQIAGLLLQKLEEGHICIDLEDESIQNTFKKDNLSSHYQLVDVVNPENYQDQPFVLFKNKIYFNRYFKYENIILSKIEKLITSGKTELTERKKRLEELKQKISIIFNVENEGIGWQLIGAISAYLNNFCIITGGPGTGKTTTVANLLALLFEDNKNLKVAVVAPTGKASARINESFKSYQNDKIKVEIVDKIKSIQALTIHRLLGGFRKYRHNAENPLDIDLLIIDESSMIDAALMAKLFSALPEQSRLIMLGDRNQLSSVEAGSIFADLCLAGLDNGNQFSTDFIQSIDKLFAENKNLQLKESSKSNLLRDCITELQISRRFDDQQGIGKFSKSVIVGNKIEINDYKSADSKQFVKIISESNIKLENDSDFLGLIGKISDYIQEPDIEKSIDKLNNFKVLCATREGKFGMNRINQLIEQMLGVKKGRSEFYHKQPILITENNPELEIFNGDIGIIIEEKDSNDNKRFIAYFMVNQKLKKVATMYLNNYETAFAMTIHKSQGSEYNSVFVLLPSDPNHPLMTRELLYTAVTRAKVACYVYGTEETINNTIEKRVKRVSGITSRIITTE